MDKSPRYLHLTGATGKVKRVTWNGVEHLSVPVVAMVEGVVWAVNSPNPEFVPAEELAMTPHQWNGRACFAGHPSVNGELVSGNIPEVLETSFGYIFHTATADEIMESRRLTLTAYLDPAKATIVGDAAISVIERLEAGETVEVSVGSHVFIEGGEGEFKGKKYKGRWTSIVSDHIAFLAADEMGACSVDAGCGANRAAVRHTVTEGDITMSVPKEPKHRTLKQRFMALFSEQEAEASRDATSSNKVYGLLYDALRASVPMFGYVEDVDQQEGFVVFCTQDKDYKQTLWKQSFNLSSKGTEVTLTGSPVEIVPMTTYVAASAAPVVAGTKPGCSCGTHPITAAADAAITDKETLMTERIKNLITASKGRFTEADASWLATVPEARLAALEAAPEPTATPVPPAPTPTPVVPTPEPAPIATPAPVPAPKDATLKTAEQIEDEFLANPSTPATVRALVQAERTRAAARRTSLVTTLKTASGEVYSEAELTAMPLPALEKLALALGIENDEASAQTSFAGRGLIRDASASAVEVPDTYDMALKQRQESKK